MNIAYYGSLPKTLKLTPPELIRNVGYRGLNRPLFLKEEKIFYE